MYLRLFLMLIISFSCLAQPQERIGILLKNAKIVTVLDQNSSDKNTRDGIIDVSVRIQNVSKKKLSYLVLEASLYEGKRKVWQALSDTAIGLQKYTEANLHLSAFYFNAKIWTAETPYQYELRVKIYDKSAHFFTDTVFYVAFKEVVFKDNFWVVNGKNIACKPLVYQVKDSLKWVEDLIQIKKLNVNTIISDLKTPFFDSLLNCIGFYQLPTTVSIDAPIFNETPLHWLTKKYQAVRITPFNIQKGIFEVTNLLDFTSLSGFSFVWQLYEDGRLIDKGELIPIDILPQQKQKISVPIYLPQDRRGVSEYIVEIAVLKTTTNNGFIYEEAEQPVAQSYDDEMFSEASSNFQTDQLYPYESVEINNIEHQELGWEQFTIPLVYAKNIEAAPKTDYDFEPQYGDNNSQLTFNSPYQITFDLQNGNIAEWYLPFRIPNNISKDTVVLENISSFENTLSRYVPALALFDKEKKYRYSLQNSVLDYREIQEKRSYQLYFEKELSQGRAVRTSLNFKTIEQYIIFTDGELLYKATLQPSENVKNVGRWGISWELPAMSEISFFGRTDTLSKAHIYTYSSKTSFLQGTEIRWLSLTDSVGKGVFLSKIDDNFDFEVMIEKDKTLLTVYQKNTFNTDSTASTAFPIFPQEQRFEIRIVPITPKKTPELCFKTIHEYQFIQKNNKENNKKERKK